MNPKGIEREDGPRASSPLHLLTLGELAATCPGEMTWVWDGLIPDGGALVLLAAFMKTGKSTFLGGLLSAIASGEPFLGRDVRQGPVMLLAVEELERDVLIRYRRLGAVHSEALVMHVGRLPDSGATWSALRKAVEQRRPALLVLDTLNRFWSVRDENDNAEVGREVGRWLAFARETKTTVLVVVHERKNGGDGGRGIRGASSLFATVDQALLLGKAQGGPATRRTLKTSGRYAESPDELLLDFEGGRYVLLGDGASRSRDMLQEKVRRALSATPQSVVALAEATDSSERMIRKALEGISGVVIEGAGKRGSPKTVRLRT